MSVSAARAIAFEILLRMETTDAYASELLHARRFEKLSLPDHGLLTELVMGVLRWRGLLDVEIAQRSSQAIARLDMEVLTALRLGAYQILFLDRVPKHAAVNESVELVKRAHKRSASGLVNAILRKVDRVAQHALQASVMRLSHPQWLTERWQKNYGPDAAARICDYDQSTPQSVVRVESSRLSKIADGGASFSTLTSLSDWMPLGANGLQLEPGKLLTEAFTVTAGNVSRSAASREGRLFIQDEGSQLVALLVGKGNAILDCCAAPGGKTRILAQENPDSTVLAMELHARRAALLKRLVSEPNVQVITADVRAMPISERFDRILVDAPCSGTGTLARNPDIKWRIQAEDLPRLQSYQVELLQSAMKSAATGGRIVYSTCSLEPEENEQVIERVLAENADFRSVSAEERLLELRSSGKLVWTDTESLLSGPYLRTIPGVHPCDGFFAAILERR